MNHLLSPAFLTPPDDVTLDAQAVHLWLIGLDADAAYLDAALRTLSPDEGDRAARFQFERDRTRFVLAHAALRAILARYRPESPVPLSFSTTKFGKPFLDGEPQFNLTHSGDLALLAVGLDAVGADIEVVRRAPDYVQIARRYFSAPEFADLDALTPDAQTNAFFTLWTRKEAFIKAIGEGLSFPLDGFDVSPMRGDAVRILNPHVGAAGSSNAASWRVHTFVPAPHYIASIALRSDDAPAPRVRCFRYAE